MAVRKAEVLYIGDAASIVRAAKEAEAAQAQLAAAAKSAGGEIAAANKVAGDSSVASATKQASAHKRASAAIASTGSALTKLTAPILLAAGAGVKFAVDFQSQMEQVHTQAGATQAEVGKMSKALLALAPSVEQGPKALAGAMYLAESASLRGKNALDAVKAAAQGAAVGGADLTDTTDALVGTMVALHEKGNMAAATMGSIDAAVGVGKMHMQDFVASLKSGIVPTAQAVGLSFNSMAAGLATMTDAGVPAEMAATKMRTILLMLANEHTKAAGENLHSIGLNSTQLAEAMRRPGNGLLDVLQLLSSHLQGISKVKKVDIISSLAGGSRSAGTLLTLLQQMGRVQNKYGQISTLSTQFNQRVAAESETAGHKIKTAWSAVQATLIQVGGAVAPVVKTLAGDVSKVARWFTSLPSGVQHAIVTGGLIVAGIGPALKIASMFERGMTALVGVAKVAGRVATTPLRLLGGGSSPLSSLKPTTTVATMEVGTLIAKGMIGGGGIPSAVGAGGGAAATEATVAEGAGGAGILATAGSFLGPAALLTAGTFIGSHLLKGLINSVDPSYGKGIADKVTAGFGPEAHAKLAAGIQTALDDANKRSRFKFDAPDPIMDGIRRMAPKLSDGQKAKIAADMIKAGELAAKGLEEGWSKFKFQSEPAMLQELQAKVKGLPPQMQAGAIQSVLAYARGLQAKGKLPAGAWQSMLAQVNNLFPGWQKSLGAAAALSAATFAEKIDLSKAEANVKTSLANMANDFPQVSKAMDKTKGDVLTKAAAAAKALRSIDVSGSAPMLAAVTADLTKLQHSTATALGKMVAVSKSSAKDMARAIQAGGALAAQSAEASFGRVASAVGRAMNSGLLSAGQGAQDIGKSLNAMLSAFGQKTIPIVGTVTQQLDWQKWWQAGATGTMGSGPGHMAKGGMVQFGRAGDRGRDNIPVNFGGSQIVVGSGEKGLVLTGEQQAEMNRRTADVGGLRGFFSRFKRPHCMSGGGPAGGWQNVVASAESLGGLGYHSNPISPYGYSELGVPPTSANVGTALGSLPYGTHMRIRAGSHEVVASKQDIGTGSSFNPRMGLYPGTVSQLGLSGGQFNVSIERADGVPLTIGGAVVAALKKMLAPTVKGSGTVANIVRAVLGKETDAANKYAQAHQPKPVSFSGSPSVGGVSGPNGVGTFQGVQVADWIIPELTWAQAHGWGGSVTSGYRPWETGSEHASLQYPGGAVDVGDNMAIPQGTALYDVLKGYPGPRKLLWGGIYITGYSENGNTAPGGHDYGHFSGTGRARGGFVPTPRAAGGPVHPGVPYTVGENGRETVTFAQGGVVQNPGAKGGGVRVPSGILHAGLNKSLIFPLDALITYLQNAVDHGLSNHKKAIANLKDRLVNLGQVQGDMTKKQREALQDERQAIKARIKALEATSAKEVTKRIADLSQLKAFRDAITQLKNTVSGLAAQAAQAFGAAQARTINAAYNVQTRAINAAHGGAFKAIDNSPAAKLLRKLQGQDVAEQNKQQIDSLNQAVTDAQFLADHSGGQTHLDALQQLKDAQTALSDYQRQQEEARLQSSLDTAKAIADKTQATALAAAKKEDATKLAQVKKEEADYKKMLQGKFAALLVSLKKGKISYATWAKDVDGILGKYHLHVPTDAGTEVTISAGPRSPGPRRAPRVQRHTVSSDGTRQHQHGQHGGGNMYIDKAYFTGTRAAKATVDRLAYRATVGAH